MSAGWVEKLVESWLRFQNNYRHSVLHIIRLGIINKIGMNISINLYLAEISKHGNLPTVAPVKP